MTNWRTFLDKDPQDRIEVRSYTFNSKIRGLVPLGGLYAHNVHRLLAAAGQTSGTTTIPAAFLMEVEIED